MAGGGAIGFGGGLARGIANSLLLSQERKREDARRAEDKKFKLLSVLEPVARQHMLETGDAQGYSDLLSQFDPDMGKLFKKQGGSPFEQLMPILAQGKGGSSAALPQPIDAKTGGTPLPQSIAAPTGGTPLDAMNPAAGITPIPPSDPGAMAPVPVEPSTRWTMGGVPIESDAERLQKQVSARMEIARKTGASPADAVRYALTNQMALPRTAAASQIIPVEIPDGKGGFTQGFANYDRVDETLTDINSGAQLPPGTRKAQTAGSTYHYGVDREAIAKAMFGKDYGALDKEQQGAVIEQEQKQLQAEAKARGTGTAQAKFEAPADLSTAQSTGVPAGTSAADVAGQNVPTTQQADRRRSLATTKTDLERITQLLDVLPSETELAGSVPGGVLAVRRRMNSDSGLKDAEGKPLSYRAAVAQLESVVDQVVNVLARVRGEQRGTQTEKDAERAYNGVVALKASLLDPFGGDTRESAKARIVESLAGLDRVLQQLPATPVPVKKTDAQKTTQPAATATPAGGTATVPGIINRNGKLYQRTPDGKEIEIGAP